MSDTVVRVRHDDNNMNVLTNDENIGEAVGKVAGVDVSSDGDAYDDDVMVDASMLSSIAALSVSVCVSISSAVSAFSAVSASSTVCASSAALNSTSPVHINPPLFSHTDSSLSSTLLEALCIFSGSLLYPSYLSSAPTAFKKMHFHTQVLYDMIHFTSYSSVTSLA
ncbi:predicted protein [Histoplasma capsulatum G186AR]|uniref:Uncharacterized protein n=2 Tax=Ajellomyces capsulatus TaxID=5037 RepID=C0NA54_AJECG|nr:uncharacterized protein HCBG_01213 [Histoplasma capsulatum G186AR]EEH11758.1 predicted protein [Histoplasma capsulatum G186AR]KAG5302379.1 hypothetical protein I7I52_00004 [Histoplasma capsulatum]QSS72222.1 hypothetical protein I7I50_03327 [Histoplasma capsulatum G186AR]